VVINIDPNVIYGMLVTIVLIVLIVQVSKIFQARIEKSLRISLANDQVTRQWPSEEDTQVKIPSERA